jgi:acetyl-CoA C-acetyltransferase
MSKTVILSAARTPIGKLGGGLSALPATALGSTAIAGALERADVDPSDVQHVVMGQVLQAGAGQIPSRQAQIGAGIPIETTSETINKVCASGMRAAGMIDTAVRAGDLQIAVGGGMESMSNAPYLLKDARFGMRMGDGKVLDVMLNDGLTNAFSGKHMAQEASEVAAELELTRPDLDRWALRSHQRALAATDDGRLADEIVAVTIKGRKGDTVVEVDEAPRRDTTLEGLSKLPPIFLKDGSHTAGNSPGVNDGAGALVLASDEWARARQRGQEGAGQGGADRAGHRPVGDQRGVRLGDAQLAANARDRRGQGERQRRCGRARPPDRRVRGADPRQPDPRAAPPWRRARLRGDLLRRRAG